MTAHETTRAIREKALDLGFDCVGVTTPEQRPDARRELGEFIASGFHGGMGWLAEKAARRGDPKVLWPEARSVIAAGMNYAPPDAPLDSTPDAPSGRANISVYARGRDYHEIMKSRLKALGRWMAETFGCGVKVFVDTAPVMEKPLAARAGLGWQGKHTNLVSRRFGSWLFLGEVFTTLELAPERGEPDGGVDHCGTCRKCLDVCPTRAFPAPYRIDARRCVSYLTIEHKGHIPRALRKPLGNRVFGCDDCLAVCPWNKFARPASEPGFQPRPGLAAPDLEELALLDDSGFRAHFSKSPIKRLRRERFIRNVLIAVGNSGAPELAKIAEKRLRDPSPLIRAMAVWALGELLDEGAFARMSARHSHDENDACVRAEWEKVA